MTRDNLNILPRISFSGKVHLIQKDSELNAVASSLLSITEFGFDTETRPSFRKGEVHPVSLLQLSTSTEAYLFRLSYLTDFSIFVKILEDENVVKAGVAIHDDIKLLQKKFAFTPRNFIELQVLAKKQRLKNLGLKGMTEELLSATISKGPKMTNWDLAVLEDRQLIYAATDAWIGLKLYEKLTAAGVKDLTSE